MDILFYSSWAILEQDFKFKQSVGWTVYIVYRSGSETASLWSTSPHNREELISGCFTRFTHKFGDIMYLIQSIITLEHSGEVPKLLVDEEFMQGSHRVVPLEALDRCLWTFNLPRCQSRSQTTSRMFWNKKIRVWEQETGTGTAVTQVVSYITGQ